jgi:ankyrin repeat protein
VAPDVIAAVRAGDVDRVRELLLAGSPSDCLDENTGASALAIVCEQGDLQLARLLLDHGANPNYMGATAWPLQAAAGRGDANLVELLLQYDAEVHVQDEDGGSPLIDAATAGHLEIVEILVEAGADVRHKDLAGQRAIFHAAERGHIEVVDFLAPLSTPHDRRQAHLTLALARQGPPTQLLQEFFDAVQRGDVEAVTAYLKSGGKVDAMDQSGETALFKAARKDHIDVVEVLIKNGANVNHLDKYGNYPLVSATKANSTSFELIEKLCSKKLADDYKKRMKKAAQMAAQYGFGPQSDASS